MLSIDSFYQACLIDWERTHPHIRPPSVSLHLLRRLGWQQHCRKTSQVIFRADWSDLNLSCHKVQLWQPWLPAWQMDSPMETHRLYFTIIWVKITSSNRLKYLRCGSESIHPRELIQLHHPNHRVMLSSQRLVVVQLSLNYRQPIKCLWTVVT